MTPCAHEGGPAGGVNAEPMGPPNSTEALLFNLHVPALSHWIVCVTSAVIIFSM